MSKYKNNIPIVFSFDSNYFIPSLVAIDSLLTFSNEDTFYDIFLLVDSSIGVYHVNKIKSSFLKFKNKNIKFISMDDVCFNNLPISKKWNKSVYYRLLIPKIINNYDKVIYSDVDVLFMKDLTEVYTTDVNNYYWGGVAAERNEHAICHQYYPENSNEFIFMSGFMLMNLKKLRDDNKIRDFFYTIDIYKERLKMFDLEVLNLSCNKIKALPIEYCVLENIYDSNNITLASEYRWLIKIYSHDELIKSKNNPAIIHYAGKDIKIWNRKKHDISIEYFDFLKNFREFLTVIYIGDNDLIGNKFNGHDLHTYLREKDIDANHLVINKESNDKTTFLYNSNVENFTDGIIKNKLFVESDIIHIHLIHNTPFDLKYFPLITKLKPTIITLHDPFFLGGHCIHHFTCDKWKTHCYDCEYLDKPFAIENDDTALRFEIKKQAIQNSDITAIVASKWMEDKVKQSPIWKGKKIYRVPFGINQDLFKPRNIIEAKKELGIKDNSITFMFRSESSPYKGLDILKEAFKNIRTKNKPTLITVAQKGLLNEFRDKFNIIEYDWVKDDNLMVRLYQACDIFLMPSRQEAFGMMAIEAMSCGKMVLALEGTSLPDVINSPNCGIACKEEEYSRVLQRLVDNPDEMIERGKKSLEFARKNYNKDVYIDRIIEIYKEVIASHKTDESADLILEQLSKHCSNYTPKQINAEANTNNNLLDRSKEDLRLSSNWFTLFGISNNKTRLRITFFGIKFTIKMTKRDVDRVAWFIPVRKWRDNFRKKFE